MTADIRGRRALLAAAAGAAVLAPLGLWAWPEEDDRNRPADRTVPTDLRSRDPRATPAARRVYALLAGLENDA